MRLRFIDPRIRFARRVGQAIIRWHRLRRMRRIFRTLPERDREVFGSVRFDNLSFIEAAERHDCSAEEVGQIIARTLVALSG